MTRPKVAAAPRAASVHTPLTAKIRPGPLAVSSAPARAGPRRADELQVLLDRASALSSAAGGTTFGIRAL